MRLATRRCRAARAFVLPRGLHRRPQFHAAPRRRPRRATRPRSTRGGRRPSDGTRAARRARPGIEGDWWILFRSDAIDGIVKQAVEHNRTLAASTATLAQAQELAAAQAGSAIPASGHDRGRGPAEIRRRVPGRICPAMSPFTYFAVGPTVSYTLDYTGGVARSVEQQYADGGGGAAPARCGVSGGHRAGGHAGARHRLGPRADRDR